MTTEPNSGEPPVKPQSSAPAPKGVLEATVGGGFDTIKAAISLLEKALPTQGDRGIRFLIVWIAFIITVLAFILLFTLIDTVVALAHHDKPEHFGHCMVGGGICLVLLVAAGLITMIRIGNQAPVVRLERAFTRIENSRHPRRKPRSGRQNAAAS